MSLAEQPSPTIDWKTAVAAAEGLGRITLIHVAQRDADAVREWCLQMARAHTGQNNAERALSYLELAVLTGHRRTEVDDLVRRGWSEIEKAAAQVVATARLQVKRAAEEKAAKETAAKRTTVEKTAAKEKAA